MARQKKDGHFLNCYVRVEKALQEYLDKVTKTDLVENIADKR